MRMSRAFLSLAAASLAALTFAAATCLSAAPAEAASGRISVKVGDQTRSAYVIERYRAKRKLRPTIIVMGDPARVTTAARRRLRFQTFTNRGGVLVYAEAAGPRWRMAGDGAAANEGAYLRALIARLRRDSLADPRRIYLVGVGAGGIAALQAACGEARLFAGVAAALASLPQGQAATCAPSRPTNLLLIAGDADKRTPFSGGQADLAGFSGQVEPVEETIRAFARAAACSGKTARRDVPDRVRTDGSRIVLERQTGCKARVSLARILGGGHFLPGRMMAGAPVRGQNRDAAAAAMITSFFKL